MRNVMTWVVAGFATVTLALAPAYAEHHEGDESAQIEAAVVSAYVEGIHIKRDPEAIRAGFHEDFVMSILRDGEIIQRTRDQWIERIEERNRERSGDEPAPKVTYEFTHVDRTGPAGVAKVKIFRDGAHIYTDYLSLYHFEDGWKIVGKIFASHN